jgi:hypothetical protein
MSPLLLAVVAAAGLLLFPGEALAWGPVTHLVHGSMLLDRLDELEPAVRALLARFPYEYLYGCIGADIIQAKKFTRSLYTHCHHWRTGWSVLEQAREDGERAFAYGYLSHLASDTFSHNYYLPVRLITSFRARPMRHVYWEARFDANQRSEQWSMLALVERTLFSFRTNKRIFDSLLALQRLEYWQSVMQRVTGSRRYPLDGADIERFNRLCAAAIVDLLQTGKHAACQAADPTGRENLARANLIRKRLRTLARRGTLDDERERALIGSLVPALDAALAVHETPASPRGA